MPVIVDFKDLRFSNAKLLEIKDAVFEQYRAVSEFIQKANQLGREIARVGWDLPEIVVTIEYDGIGKDVEKFLSKIAFKSSEGDLLEIGFGYGFDKRISRSDERTIAARSYSVNERKYYLYNLEDYPRGVWDWQDQDTWLSASVKIDEVLEKLAHLPTAPGYDDKNLEGDANLRRLCESEIAPVPEGFPILYSWVDSFEGENASSTWSEPHKNRQSARRDYKLRPTPLKFCIDGDALKWSEIPEQTARGFAYASADCNQRSSGLAMKASGECLPIEIRLKCLNDIYVYDRSSFEYEAVAQNEFALKNAIESFIPAAEYKGGYANPVYCIGRQLDESEARPMDGLISVKNNGDLVVAELKDNLTDKVVTVFEGEAGLESMLAATEISGKTAKVLKRTVDIDPDITDRIEQYYSEIADARNNRAFGL